MQVMITNGGTHSPQNWADHVLDELVPLPPNAAVDVLIKVGETRGKLRPAVEEAIAACRLYEQQLWDQLKSDEKHLLVDMVRYRHGLESKYKQVTNDLSHYSRKVSSAERWLDDAVVKVAREMMKCDGEKVGNNRMMDNIYTVLKRWILSVQDVERSHHVTSRDLVNPNSKD